MMKALQSNENADVQLYLQAKQQMGVTYVKVKHMTRICGLEVVK